MKCSICREGETKEGKTTVFLNRDDANIIIKDVPAEICTNCNEYYLSEDITDTVLKIAEEAVRKGAEVEVIRFAA